MIWPLSYATGLIVPLMMTLAAVVTVTVIVAWTRTLSVSALVIPVIAVTITVVLVTLMMSVMAFVPGVFLRLCVCFWSALLLGLGGLWGGEVEDLSELPTRYPAGRV